MADPENGGEGPPFEPDAPNPFPGEDPDPQVENPPVEDLDAAAAAAAADAAAAEAAAIEAANAAAAAAVAAAAAAAAAGGGAGGGGVNPPPQAGDPDEGDPPPNPEPGDNDGDEPADGPGEGGNPGDGPGDGDLPGPGQGNQPPPMPPGGANPNPGGPQVPNPGPNNPNPGGNPPPPQGGRRGVPPNQNGANNNRGQAPGGGNTGRADIQKLLTMNKQVDNPDAYQQVQMLAETVALTMDNLSKFVAEPVPDKLAMINTFKALAPVVQKVQKEATASHARAQNSLNAGAMSDIPPDCVETKDLPLMHKTNIVAFGKDDRVKLTARCREFIRQVFSASDKLSHRQIKLMFLRHTTGRANALLYDLNRDGADLEGFIRALEADYAQLCTAEEAHVKLGSIEFDPETQTINELAQTIRSFAQMATRHDPEATKLINERTLAKQTLTRCLPVQLRLAVEKEQRRLSSLGRPIWPFSEFTIQVENIRLQLEVEQKGNKVQKVQERKHFLENEASSVRMVRSQQPRIQQIQEEYVTNEYDNQRYCGMVDQIEDHPYPNQPPQGARLARQGPRSRSAARPRPPQQQGGQQNYPQNPQYPQRSQSFPKNRGNRAPYPAPNPTALPAKGNVRNKINYLTNVNAGYKPMQGAPQYQGQGRSFRPANANQGQFHTLASLNIVPGECMRCGLEGHKAFKETSELCPLGQKPLTFICPKCNKGGHLVTDCPSPRFAKN